MKRFIFFFISLFIIFLTPQVYALDNAFVSVVNPIRGSDFWDIKDQTPETAVLGQIGVLNKFNFPATWLIRFDVLGSKSITEQLQKRSTDDKGLFLEVTPSWANEAKVQYHRSNSWHNAGSAFLTGYEPAEREKLIDTSFEKFKFVFGSYPASVGAWWIDSYSLGYMQKKYGITAALIVSDQYSTDNYQIWGQYFSTPYYPAKNNALHPAQTEEDKLNVVMMQWAPRDPVNSYGNGVMESTYSVQANDYISFHSLDTKYFSKLVDIYTKQEFNQFAHLVVGLENSYSWTKYADEYQNQMAVLASKVNLHELSVISMKDFANWYKLFFPKISPAQLIIADDPLGSFKKAVWFMDPYFRVGWFINTDGSVLRDIRQYVGGEEELCLHIRCDAVNFATSATRVLDDVSFGQRWVIDEGRISDFKVEKKADDFIISYRNEAGNIRQIGLLPRDISVDGKVYSIDSAILSATKKEPVLPKNSVVAQSALQWSMPAVILKISQFLAFLILAILLPGLMVSNKLSDKKTPLLLRLFISATAGFVVLTLLFYLTSLLKIRQLMFIYLALSVVVFIRFRYYTILHFSLPRLRNTLNLILILVILTGTIFQVIPTFNSGLTFNYGLGFWGPNTHDGVWHLALTAELLKAVPAQNPIYSGAILKNYHFFYDLLIAATAFLSGLPVIDLVFRFYPVFFSLMLGLGSYYLVMKIFEGAGAVKIKVAAIFSLYLIYFAGSFGWIVEFLRERHLGGESAFWANQAVSFNLNPPFASSLLIIIALLLLIFFHPKKIILPAVLAGALIGFKSYGAILFLGTMLIMAILRKHLPYLIIFAAALLVSAWIFLSNFEVSSALLVFAPFWLIHTMIDSPDRVGWARLSLAREAGLSTNNWFKFILAETISFLIFIAGNLGVRIVGIFSLTKIKKIIQDEKKLFIFIFILMSFLIPILFIQSGNPWNTIQFSYYGLYLAAVAGGIMLSSIVLKLQKYILVVVILLVFLLAPINSVVTASGYITSKPHAFISSQELKGLLFLSNQLDGVVLTFPYDEKLKQKLAEPWPIFAYDSTAYVSAISGKSVYLEDEPQNQILLIDYQKRLVASKDFFQNPTSAGLKFLQDNHISYVYIPKIYNIRLDESSRFIKNIFENEEVVIYKIN